MARDQRPVLRTIITAADAYKVRRKSRLVTTPIASEAALFWLEGDLKRLSKAVGRLGPQLRTLRPDAPWLDAVALGDLGLLLASDAIDAIDWKHVDRVVAATRKAGEHILAALEGRAAPLSPGEVAAPAMLQLKVILVESHPAIWRRLLVPNDITLRRLHNVLQVACGWSNSHLHSFEVAGGRYGRTDPEWETDLRSDTHVRLNRLGLRKGSKIEYVYDFGDYWVHDIRVEATHPAVEGEHRALCLAGARAFPPEDCGGIDGYEHVLAALADPLDEEHDELKEWVGPYFDPERIDLDRVNWELQAVSRGRAPGIGWG